MIVIEKAKVITKRGKARLSAMITIPEEAYRKWIYRVGNIERYKGYKNMYQYQAGEFEMWYEVDECYKSFLCYERNDAFILAVLYFAMMTGEDIVSQGAVSSEFYHHLNTYLIPMHCNERTGDKRIHILADDINSTEFSAGHENGTGISCGVDSFDTILTYMADDIDDAHRLSFVTVFNAGAFYGMGDMQKCIKQEMTIAEWNQIAEERFLKACAKGMNVAEQLGLSFLAVNSNLSDLYQGTFLQSHAYRNCSAVLAIQKLFKHYYYASAGEPTKPYVGLENAASDNVQFFSTESVRFYLANDMRTRVEKIKYISDNEIVRQNLYVCYEDDHNCGRCGKCKRTMLILDIIGKIEFFEGCFDNILEFQRRKWKNYVWILDQLDKDYYARDLFEYMKRNHIKIQKIVWMYHYTLPMRKLIKKIIGQ